MKPLYAKAVFDPSDIYVYRHQLLKKIAPCTWKAIFHKQGEDEDWQRFAFGREFTFSSRRPSRGNGRMIEFQVLSDVEFFNEFL